MLKWNCATLNMSQLLDFILNQKENFRRQVAYQTHTHSVTSHYDEFGSVRLPSLYSDFSPQKYTNPDGFDTNVHAWFDVLRKAAWQGLLPPGIPRTDILSLTLGEELLVALESEEWGRPQALGAVIVGQYNRDFCSFHRLGNDSACLQFNVQTGRSSFAAVVSIRA